MVREGSRMCGSHWQLSTGKVALNDVCTRTQHNTQTTVHVHGHIHVYYLIFRNEHVKCPFLDCVGACTCTCMCR